MNAHFDTSVFATLAFADPGFERIDRWIATAAPALSFSNFGWGELTSAVGQRVRATALDPEIGKATLAEATIYLRGWMMVAITTQDVDDAAAMIADFALNVRLPDAIHVAVARRIGAVLVTTDRRQLRAARSLRCEVLNPLYDETGS